MYKFYLNVDTHEICQIYIDETKVKVPEWKEAGTFDEKLEYDLFFSPYLHEITGVWSDCYMPVNIAFEMFSRYIVMPDEIASPLNVITEIPFEMGLTQNTSCIYRTLPNKMLHLVQCRKHLSEFANVSHI